MAHPATAVARNRKESRERRIPATVETEKAMQVTVAQSHHRWTGCEGTRRAFEFLNTTSAQVS